MKFIKVTPKGSKDFTVVPNSLESFYKANGYKVEKPTQEEIELFHPTAKAQELTAGIQELVSLPVTESPEYVALNAELEAKVAELEAEKAKVAELEAKVAELTEVKPTTKK